MTQAEAQLLPEALQPSDSHDAFPDDNLEGAARSDDRTKGPLDAIQDYWDRNPWEATRSHKPRGTRDYFKDIEMLRYQLAPHIPDFADFDSWRGAAVLEVGCGIGTDTVNFGRGGADVTAVDISEASASLAEQRAEVYGLEDRITFVLGNVETLAKFLGPARFDLAYAFGVLSHTPSTEAALKELHALLKPGAKLKVMVYHRRSLRVLGIVLWRGFGAFWRTDSLVNRHGLPERGCPLTKVFGRKQARRLVERAGFKVTRISVDHIYPYPKSSERSLKFARKWRYSLIPGFLFRFLERHFGWHLLIEAEA